MSNTSIGLSPRWRVAWGFSLVAALLFVGAGLFWNTMRDSRAAPADKSVAIRYLNISGDGPSARTWYDGAPPAGVPVQAALDEFAKQGFQVVEISQRLAVAAGEASVWTILLERVQ